MIRNNNVEIAMKWLAAFNSADLEQLLALYDENAEHLSPKLKAKQPATGGIIKGKSSLEKWWREAFEQIPTLHYKPTAFTADKDSVLMEYVRIADGEADINVAEVLEIKNGLIIASRVYHG